MSLTETFKILCDLMANRTPKWLLWKPNALPASDEVDEAYKLCASSPPEIALSELARLIWNADELFLAKLDPLFLKLASQLPVCQWPTVDEQIRASLCCHGYKLRSSNDESISKYESQLIIALCHPSGRVREKAIRNSKAISPKLSTPLLLIRVNDWVEQVRNTAAEKLTEPLNELGPDEKLALVPVLLRLRECRRHQKLGMLETWLKVLTIPFDEQARLTAWVNAKGRDRRIYLEILKSSGRQPSMPTRRALLQSNDRLALFWIIREVLPTLTTGEREEALITIRKSRVVAVKREWLSHCLESCSPGEIELLLKEAMLDPSRGMRQLARFHLSRSSPMDFAGFYREALAQPQKEAVALEALAEVAPDDAHREALPRLDSKVPAILKAALRSLSSGSLGEHLDFLMQAVGSELPGVSKVARKRLFEVRRMVGVELIAKPELWNSFPETTRFQLVRMASDFQKWDSLEFLLVRQREGTYRDETKAALRIWHQNENRVFSKLGSTRKERLLTQVASAGLDSDYAESLRFRISHAE